MLLFTKSSLRFESLPGWEAPVGYRLSDSEIPPLTYLLSESGIPPLGYRLSGLWYRLSESWYRLSVSRCRLSDPETCRGGEQIKPSSDALFEIVPPPEGGGGVAPFLEEEEELRFSLVLTGELKEGKEVANLGGRAELGDGAGGGPGGTVLPPEGGAGFSY